MAACGNRNPSPDPAPGQRSTSPSKSSRRIDTVQKTDFSEIDLLKCIREKATSCRGKSPILQMLDGFWHTGPNGTHACLVFPAMGPDMAEYRQLFPDRRIPMPVMKTISRQLLRSLAFLHDTCQIIHTGKQWPFQPFAVGAYTLLTYSFNSFTVDIKPRNILIETPSIREMFAKAPSEVLLQENPPDGPIIPSVQLYSAEEDLSQAKDISVKLADFGAGMLPWPIISACFNANHC